jgi:actin related protein 2/3 complex subunit 5
MAAKQADDDEPNQEMGDEGADSTSEASFQAALKQRETKANGALSQCGRPERGSCVRVLRSHFPFSGAASRRRSPPPSRTLRSEPSLTRSRCALTSSARGSPESKQDRSADLVVSILVAVKEADIKGILDGLNDDQVDLLMKYIYRGMALAENRCVRFLLHLFSSPIVQPRSLDSHANPLFLSSAALLKWHGAVVDKAGIGSIVRVLAERKSVV